MRVFLVIACWLFATGCWITDARYDARMDLDGDGVRGPVDCDDRDPTVGAAGAYYPDVDGDGYGAIVPPYEGCDPPESYILEGGDCDDDDFARHPGAEEVCDGVDNDCRFGIDDGLPEATYWYDRDGDGFGDPGSVPLVLCKVPPLHVPNDDDCDDLAKSVNPDAQEVCSGQDDDCDGLVDLDDPSMEGDATWYVDADADGFGDSSQAVVSCERPNGAARDAGDCDDADPSRNPAAIDLCDDGIDQDCDGIVDNLELPVTWYADEDADGYGDGDQPVVLWECAQLAAHAANPLDCVDDNPFINPAADEVCDGIDNDCDGLVDFEDTVEAGMAWYPDVDGDGWGGPEAVFACEAPPGHVDLGGDCDDLDPATSPAAPDTCGDGIDQDCSGVPDDDAGPFVYYRDADGDGWGTATEPLSTTDCEVPAGHAAVPGDCVDGDADINPDAAEVCGGGDEDCDGLVDDEDPDRVGGAPFYADTDGDGFGDPAVSELACVPSMDFVDDATDCDDSDPDVSPDGVELCNGIDDNCSGAVDEGWTPDGQTFFQDLDGDGYGNPDRRRRRCSQPTDYVSDANDCDDADAAVNPAATEVCGNGVDDDCDGTWNGCPSLPSGELDSADIVDVVARAASDDRAGWSLANAGDQNGDGLEDLLVGAPHSDGRTGGAYLIHGPVVGSSIDSHITFTGTVADSETGDGLADAADYNGDGAPDLVISGHKAGTGVAYMLLGPVTASISLAAADAVFSGWDDDSHFGEALASIGDTNADGFDELLIGAHSDGLSANKGGAVYLFLGSAAPSDSGALADAAAIYTPESDGDIGKAVADAGDTDGDGLGELLMSADRADGDRGRTYLFTSVTSGTQDAGDADAILTGSDAGERSGVAIDGAGDINGDGHDDLIIGAPRSGLGGGNSGVAYVVLGPVTGPQDLATASALLVGAANSRAGEGVRGLGDVDGDGLDDVVVGAPSDDANGGDAGAAYVVYGAPTGTVDLSTDADLRIRGEGPDHLLGNFSVGLDANGDGAADLAVGAHGAGANGAVYLVYGGGL